jgi:CheY-like chemotaxis protein
MSSPQQLLLVEDSPTQAARIVHLIRSRGYKIEVAHSGADALKRVPILNPVLILSDVTMPEMSGYELCKRLKEEESSRHIPVMLITGLAGPEDILAGLEAGADGYLVKPYEDSELFDKIEFLLEQSEVAATEDGLMLHYKGQSRPIRATRQQMLNVLLTTYQGVISQNRQMQRRELEAKLKIQELQEEIEELQEQLEAGTVTVTATTASASGKTLADFWTASEHAPLPSDAPLGLHVAEEAGATWDVLSPILQQYPNWMVRTKLIADKLYLDLTSSQSNQTGWATWVESRSANLSSLTCVNPSSSNPRLTLVLTLQRESFQF